LRKIFQAKSIGKKFREKRYKRPKSAGQTHLKHLPASEKQRAKQAKNIKNKHPFAPV